MRPGKNTKAFKKRFHGLSLKDKVAVAGLVNDITRSGKFPSGNKIDAEEKTALSELSEWCDENIFFNKMPNGEYAERTHGIN